MADLNKIKLMAQAILDEVSGATVPDPTPVPDPVPVPTPIPETPMTTEELVDGLGTGATPCGIVSEVGGMKVAGVDQLPAGISVTATTITFNSFTGDLYDDAGWDFGNRRLVFNSHCGYLGNIRFAGGVGSMPLIHCQPGGGFEGMEHIDVLDCAASMVFKQENAGIAGLIRRWKIEGLSQDAFKTSGLCVVEENKIGFATYRGGAPHSDAHTAMASFGDTHFRKNFVDWQYANVSDQSGINNLNRIESYKVGNRFDNIFYEDNKFLHANPVSFGIQVATKNSPLWIGSIQYRRNRFQKAGGNPKILYAPSSRISVWEENIDLNTGLVIPLSAT